MKKTKVLTFLLIIVGIIVLLGFLTMGKCTKIIILNNENRESSYHICRGELVGAAGGSGSDPDVSLDELLKTVDSVGESRTYFNDNVFNKGYSNSQVVSMIKDHLEPKGIEITVKDEGIVFVGFNWIVHKFSR